MNALFEYRNSLDALRFTPEQKAALAAGAADAAKGKTHRRPLWRTALIAACLTAALAVGAGASGVLKSAVEVFAPIFGGSAAQTEVIDKIGHPIGAGDTDNGVTITADAIIGDAYNAAIVYTIRRDDGTTLLPEGTDAKSLLMGGFGGASLDVRGGSHGSSWFVANEADGSAVQLVQTVSADCPINGCTATAEFEDLCVWDEAQEAPTPVVEGHWKFRFDVDYEDSSVTLGGGETFTQNGMTFTVDAITLSPVAVKVDYTVDHEVQWSDAPSGRLPAEDSRQMERYFENVEILLTKTDGTVIDLSASGGKTASPSAARGRFLRSSCLWRNWRASAWAPSSTPSPAAKDAKTHRVDQTRCVFLQSCRSRSARCCHVGFHRLPSSCGPSTLVS